MRITRTPIIAMNTETGLDTGCRLIEALDKRADGLPKETDKAEATAIFSWFAAMR